MIPATRKLAIEILASVARMIASTLGGMIGSSVAPARIVPIDSLRSQPRWIMVG